VSEIRWPESLETTGAKYAPWGINVAQVVMGIIKKKVGE